MSGPHLGTRTTPLVDGRLAPDAALRAHDHLAQCGECDEAVAGERLVRDRLTGLGAPEVSPDLMARLLDIGGPSGPLPPRDRPMAVPARPVTGVAPPSRTGAAGPISRTGAAGPVSRTGAVGPQRPAGRSRPWRGVRRHPLAAALAGTFSLVGAGVVGVLVLGGSPGGAPSPVAEFRTTPSASVSVPVSATTTPVLPTGTTTPGASSTASGTAGPGANGAGSPSPGTTAPTAAP